MQLATRPWNIAGVVFAGAGAIMITPTAPLLLPSVEFRDVQLTSADIDPITAIQDVFTLAQTNLTSIGDHFLPVPFPTLQQLIADPGSFDLDKIANAAVTPFLPQSGLPPGDMAPAFLYPSLTDNLHLIGYNLLQGMFTSDMDKELLAFSASPLSGVLLGDLGPLLDPGLALQNSIQDALTAPDSTAAFNDLLNIPANMADATLNGAFLDGTAPTLDLTPVLSLLPAGTIPSTVDISSLDLTLGGLLSPGGSVFNALGVDLTKPLMIDISGHPDGPIGSLIELDQATAAALGFNFNDVSATTELGTLSTSLEDLLNSLTSGLGGDLSTTLGGSLTPELGTLTADILSGLTSFL